MKFCMPLIETSEFLLLFSRQPSEAHRLSFANFYQKRFVPTGTLVSFHGKPTKLSIGFKSSVLCPIVIPDTFIAHQKTFSSTTIQRL